jgi:hypothetical protein
MNRIYVILTGVLLMAAFSCKKPEIATLTPTISYLSYQHLYDINNFDTTGILKLYFTDGNGQLGMDQSDPGADYFSYIHYKKNGFWIRYDTAFNYRLPYLVGQGVDGTLKGEIDITYNNIILSTFPGTRPDTIEFECYIVDRYGNASNTILTPQIIIH